MTYYWFSIVHSQILAGAMVWAIFSKEFLKRIKRLDHDAILRLTHVNRILSSLLSNIENSCSYTFDIWSYDKHCKSHTCILLNDQCYSMQSCKCIVLIRMRYIKPHIICYDWDWYLKQKTTICYSTCLHECHCKLYMDFNTMKASMWHIEPLM